MNSNAAIRRSHAPSANRRKAAALAQLVEHIIRNDGVACSSHASGTKFSYEDQTSRFDHRVDRFGDIAFRQAFVSALSPDKCWLPDTDGEQRRRSCLDAPRQSRFGVGEAPIGARIGLRQRWRLSVPFAPGDLESTVLKDLSARVRPPAPPPSDYESGGQEFESLRARHLN